LAFAEGLGGSTSTTLTTTAQSISINTYTNSDPRITMSGNNITINEPGTYNLDFRGLIESSSTLTSNTTNTLTMTLVPISGSFSSPLGSSIVFGPYAIGSNTTGTPAIIDHLNATFDRIIQISPSSIPYCTPVTFQISATVSNTTTGLVTTLLPNYTINVNQLKKF